MPLEFSTTQVQPDKPNKQFSKVYDELLQTLVNVLFLMRHCTPTTTQMDIMICNFKKNNISA